MFKSHLARCSSARFVAIAGCGVLAACSNQPRQGERPRADLRVETPRSVAPAERAVGTYKIGKPYRIGDRWYEPAEDPGYDRTGIASWYGRDFHGKRTANGETYDLDAITAAHPTLPLPSYVYVTNTANGRTVLVRVNDRGPYIAGRIIDLSRGTARLLGTEANGLGHVRVRYAGRAPLDGDNRAERAFLAAQPWYGGQGFGTRMSLGALMAVDE